MPPDPSSLSTLWHIYPVLIPVDPWMLGYSHASGCMYMYAAQKQLIAMINQL